MGGFFDEWNDALVGFAAGSGIGDRIAGYMDQARARAQALQDTRDYQTLLARYNVGVNNPGDVPAAFFLEAAQIPSLRAGLLSGAQTQGGAMARQQQAQQFGLENVPLADRLRMEAEAKQQQAEAERRAFEWDNPSAYQKAMIENAQAGLELQRKSALLAERKGLLSGPTGIPDPEKGKFWTTGPDGGLVQENIPGGEKAREAQLEASRLARALGSLDRLEKFYSDEGTFAGGAVGGAAAADYLDVVAARAKKADAGAMSDQEIEFYGSGLANPIKAGSLLTRTSTALGTVQGIRTELQTQLLDFLEANPEVARNNPQLVALVAQQAADRKKSRSLLGGR